jgi:hypothetical protein
MEHNIMKGVIQAFTLIGILTAAPLPAFAIGDCTQWADQVTSSVSIGDSVTAETHTVYCEQYGSDAGAKTLADAKLLGWDSSYLKITRTWPTNMTLGLVGFDQAFEGGGFDARVIETEFEDSSVIAVQQTHLSASNISHEVVIIQLGWLTMDTLGLVKQPLNMYQANNRNGSESDIVGFYKNSSGDTLIDTLAPDINNDKVCNACRKYNVVSMGFSGDSFTQVSIRPFDVDTYNQQTGE